MQENYAIWQRQNPPRKRPFESTRDRETGSAPNPSRIAASSHQVRSAGVAIAAPSSKISQSFC
jgi:hypothetical protein